MSGVRGPGGTGGPGGPGGRRLIGVGVGPGDPELVTVKAVRVLREAGAIVVPVMAGAPDGSGRAEATVLAYVAPDRIVRAPFALDDTGGVTARRAQAWDDAARVVLAALDGGAASVAFATIGDPNVYSTFAYLAQTVRALDPTVEVSTVPGITAMQDLAARSGTVLAEGREPLTLVPLTAGVDVLDAGLAGPGTVVAYKGWRRMEGVRAAIERHGRTGDAVVGSGLGMPGEWIGRLGDVPGPLPYLSTVLVPPRRSGRGEKL